jgi:hypothetical protein
VWEAPEYSSLRAAGVLANMLPPWESETYRKPLDAAVVDVDKVPFASGSTDSFLTRVITDEWAHDLVLTAVAPYEAGSPP